MNFDNFELFGFLMTNLHSFKTKSCLYILFSLILLIITQSYADIPVSEVRFGVMRNDIHGNHLKYRHEKGYNFSGEILFPEFTGGIWEYLFNPKLHMGGAVNVGGYTSHVYTGLTWFIRMGPFVIEPTFGFDANNAEHHKKYKKRQCLGSNIMFRESISFGYKISKCWTGYLMIDHVSHAHIFHPNPGLSTIGIRFGYAF